MRDIKREIIKYQLKVLIDCIISNINILTAYRLFKIQISKLNERKVMSKTVPNFLFPTNFRNGKNIKRLIKDFNVQGYGIAVYLLETLAETEGHQYPLSDIDLLADEMKVSVPVINTVINTYGLFQIVENEDGSLFFSSQLNDWLEPYYRQVQQRSMAGKLSAAKKKQKQQEQLKQLEMNLSDNNLSQQINLSESDSSQRPFNDCSTINKINKERNKEKKNLSDNFRNFKKELQGIEIRFTLPYPFENFSKNTVIRLKKTGYLHNESISKDLSTEQAHIVWEYMFEKREQLLKIISYT